jgi:integrase/recombinase XerC
MVSNYEKQLRSFQDYLKFERRYSQHTIRAYHDDLRQFFDFLQLQFGSLQLSEISSSLIRSWLAGLKEEALVAKSINRKISTLKSFFKYQLKTGALENNPMTTVISPKASKRLPGFVKQAETSTLFKYVEFPDDWAGKTERLILQILYGTGVRLSELINIRESQVDTGLGNLKVLGKGNKERIIPLQSDLRNEIAHYMKEKRNELEKPDEKFLLVNQKGRKLYSKYVYRVVRKYLSMITTIEKKSPHILRHSFATHLMNNGADLNAVKELLGHSSLAATQVYTHNSIEKLKDVYKKAHPKA